MAFVDPVSTWDVVVIGAGAAGLSACRDLTRAGFTVICVEARNRVGGRILTMTDPYAPLPIELGAEFVHGRPGETWRLLRDGNLTVFDCEENAVHVVDGQVQQQADSWDQIQAVTEAMKTRAGSGPDCTFLEFIDKSRFSDEAKGLATGYVEGFNAGRKEEISVASLAEDAAAAEKISGDRNFRIANGYQAVINTLAGGIDTDHFTLSLSTVVERVTWSDRGAEVFVRRNLDGGKGETLYARRVVVTLPLGVLQAGSVTFSPVPQDIMEAAQALRFGHVMRLVLRFSEAWWEEIEHLADAGFWLSRERYFPTWWTTLPVRSTLLTGWSAGPHADGLLGLSKDEIAARGLDDLSRITNQHKREITPMLEGVYLHDWSSDPFALGAYSYVPAGAMHAREVLATPVKNILFFAGEATETEGHSATVHGAIASGKRAAAQIRSCGA